MDAIEYLKEKARMTNNCNTCNQCLLDSLTNRTELNCQILENLHPEQAVEIVEKWAKENPVKTYLSVLLEKLPNVKLNNDDIPKTVCPNELFNLKEQGCPDIKCINCWNREYKEEE